jgi:hypothetical protein
VRDDGPIRGSPCARDHRPYHHAILLGLLSLLNVISPLFPSEKVPTFVIYFSVVLGVVGLVAVGLWMLRRWSFRLTIIFSVLNILSAAPGIAFAPTAWLQVLSAVTVVGFALIIVLVVLPTSRHAFAAS